jgi:hypothetical protein
MKTHGKLGGPAFVLAMIALFVSLTSGAVAAGIVPLAKHALTADTATNAKKLGGQTPAQIHASLKGAQGPAGPAGPAAAMSVSTHAQQFSVAANDGTAVTAMCASGQKAISGGVQSDGTVLPFSSYPTTAGDGWTILVINIDDGAAHNGNVYAVCVS